MTEHLSDHLQIGKAAEHLVCADLILQGFSAFLADQGLPYDVLIDRSGAIERVQVRSSQHPKTVQGVKDIYRYSTRRSKGANRAVRLDAVDWFAFVALDVRSIAYLKSEEIAGGSGDHVMQCIQFRSTKHPLPEGACGPDHHNSARFLEQYSDLRERP